MLVQIDDDFDLNKIVESGQCFRATKLNSGTFQFITQKNILFIHKEEEKYNVSCTDEEWSNIWWPYFDFDHNYSSIRQSIPPTDTFMKKAAEYGSGIRILQQDPWETMISFIISQRKSIPSIKQSIELLSYSFGSKIETLSGSVFTFPTCEELVSASFTQLEKCKLGYRINYVLEAINSVASGAIRLDLLHGLDDDSLLQKLKSIKGIGNKVASCIALFAYGRLNVAPIDTWIHKIILSNYRGVSPFDRYNPYSGIMQQYAFYYAQKNKRTYAYG